MSKSTEGGIGICGATFIVFLIMRLTDHIDWAWYWVASPLWIPAAVVLSSLAIVFARIPVHCYQRCLEATSASRSEARS